MNFDFAADELQSQQALRRLFAESGALRGARAVMEGGGMHDAALWQELARLGYLGAAIPEHLGGAGAGPAMLCVLAEEAGRCLAALPLCSSLYLGAALLRRAADTPPASRLLPEIAAGSCILAIADGAAKPASHALPVWRGGMLTGTAAPVPDAAIAHALIIEAADAEAGGTTLILLDRGAPGLTIDALETIDPSRPQARLRFAATPGERLGRPGQARILLDAASDHAAVLVAFEQIGGAAAALDMARAYALERRAFGRPIAGFQAIKHKLVDMHVALTLARANALYAAWALETEAAELPHAAAIARVSATEAFQLCARENIQVHGGFGFTWEADCHMFHRRAQFLALTLRGGRYWRDRAVATLPAAEAA